MAPPLTAEEKTLRARATKLTSSAKWRAKKKGLPFEIDRELVLEKLRSGKCKVSGLPFSYDPAHVGRKRNGFAPSLHRRDCTQGYTRENTMLVCVAANVAISELTHNEFLLLALAILRAHDLA
ncbi:MAG: hypothetical protein QNJ14_04230 [Woeseiaceae bacterium]|nr:hypothetical protein [Woeseiaceae bacterium]